MYDYKNSPDRAHCYRPDLVPLISEWLDSVPEIAWRTFACFRVGDHGEFVAKFVVSPDRGGPPRTITVTLDHDMYVVCNDAGAAWIATEPSLFHASDIVDAANHI